MMNRTAAIAATLKLIPCKENLLDANPAALFGRLVGAAGSEGDARRMLEVGRLAWVNGCFTLDGAMILPDVSTNYTGKGGPAFDEGAYIMEGRILARQGM